MSENFEKPLQAEKPNDVQKEKPSNSEKPDSAPIEAPKPQVREGKEKRKRVTEETSRELEEVKTETLEDKIKAEPETRKELPKKKAPDSSAERKEKPIKKSEKKTEKAPSFLGNLFGFEMKDLGKKYTELKNKLIFGAGSFLKVIHEMGFLKKGGRLDSLISYFGDSIHLSEALKEQQFEGMTELHGFNVNNVLAVHKRNFSTVALDIYFAKVSAKARSMTDEKMVDFKTLTEAASSLQSSDFSKEELVSDAKKSVPEQRKEDIDLLQVDQPLKVAGQYLRLDKSKGIIEAVKKYQFKNGDLPNLRIAKATLTPNDALRISLISDENLISGEVNPNDLRDILSGYFLKERTLQMQNSANTQYQIQLEQI